MSRPAKRSVVLEGRKTSISLEDPFFEYLTNAAKAKGITFSGLVESIAKSKDNETSLSCAMRLYALELATCLR